MPRSYQGKALKKSSFYAKTSKSIKISAVMLVSKVVQARPGVTTLTQLGSVVKVPPMINCEDIMIGSNLKDGLVDDVVAAGAVRPNYLSGSVQFSQSAPHTFYIRGSSPLANNDPIVYSMNNSVTNEEVKQELRAITNVSRENDLLKVEVSYADTPCQNEYELMQMDV